MSAFNVVSGVSVCPSCSRSSCFDVQFKYGDTWQYTYRIGDVLRWGGNDIGTPGHKRVLVEAVGGPCAHCGADCLDFNVLIKNDELARIEPIRGERGTSWPEGFIVLE